MELRLIYLLELVDADAIHLCGVFLATFSVNKILIFWLISVLVIAFLDRYSLLLLDHIVIFHEQWALPVLAAAKAQREAGHPVKIAIGFVLNQGEEKEIPEAMKHENHSIAL